MPMPSLRKLSEKPSDSPVPADTLLPTAAWSARATAALRQAARNYDPPAFCRAWRDLLHSDQRHLGHVPAGWCLWSLFDAHDGDPIVQLTRKVFAAKNESKPVRNRAAMKTRHPFTEDVSSLALLLAQKLEPWSAADCLIAGEVLLTSDDSLDSSLNWVLWQRLAVECRRSAAVPSQETPDQLVLRSGEIPWLAGILLEPWSEAKKLRELGRRTLIKELIARTDSDGTPHAELLPRMPLWLAPLIRATLWAERFGHTLWSDGDRQRLALVLERAIPLCRPDGRLAMSNGLAIPALALFDVAVKTLSLTGPAEKLLRNLSMPPTATTLRKRSPSVVETMPSNQSDWARFAMLRSDWSPQADCLAISHHQAEPMLDVSAFGKPILHGPWGWELQIGDAGIAPADEWSCSCWFSDPDADYLELQMTGPGALRVERQILLSRKDHFLLLADCVRGGRSVSDAANEDRIHLRTRLPLAAGVIAETDKATREVRLKSGKQAVRVFPLGLADDRIQSTPHRCEVDEHEIVLHQIGQGNGLYAPLIFDWHPARSRQPALWRTLTVAEGGKVLGRDLAAGHRLQIGKYQLLVYRSLAQHKTARTVLGHHTWHESVIARFDSDGDVEAIMNVDP